MAQEMEQLVALLQKYRDVFAWTYDEIPGLDPGLVVHSLNVDPRMRPVVQPARVFHTEVEAQIVQEVKKLLTTGFIKPIQHPKWLSNIVPVKKKNGQIRCCVDFRNLNKACLKDEFPCPISTSLWIQLQEAQCSHLWMGTVGTTKSAWLPKM